MAYEKYRSWRYIASFSLINYLQASATFLLTLLLARFLPVSIFGDYRFGILILSIVSVAGLYGADKGLLIDLVHRKKESLTLLAYYFVRVCIAIGVGFIVILYAILAKRHSQVTIVCIFTAAAIPMALRSAGWFEFQERLRQHAALLLLDKVLLVLAAGAILAFGIWQVNASLLGVLTIITITLTFGLELGIILRQVNWSQAPASPVLTESRSIIGRYGWVWLLALTNMLMTSFSQLVLYSRGGQNELAYLGFALQFAAISRLFMQQVVRLKGASIAVKTDETRNRLEIARHLMKTVRVVGFSGAVLSVVTAGAATIIISKFFAEKYLAALPAVWILHAWIIVLGIGLNVNRYIVGLKLQKPVFFTTSFWAIISIFVTYVLAPEYGAAGYACVLLVCHAASIMSQCIILFTTSD